MDEPADGVDLLTALARAAAAEPEVPAHHANLGAALHAAGRYDEAVTAHERALAALARQRATVRYNLGASLAELGRLDEAAAAYEGALSDQPGWVPALDNLGAIRQRQGRTADAERAYRAALALEPQAVTHYNLGVLRYGAGDPIQAIEHLLAARAGSPPSAAIEHALALAYTAAERLPEAIAAHRAALALDPTLVGSQAQLALLSLRTGDAAGALTAAEAACAEAPDDAGAHGLRGAALASLARHGEAAAAYDVARDLAPDRFEVHVSCARGAEALGDREAAVASYRAALARAPEHLPALEHLIRLLIELDRAAEAIPVCERVLALAPEHPIAPHQLAALRGEVTAAAPRAYVVAMFDQMADRFDQHLVGVLDYHVPEAVRAAVDRVAPGRRFARALDLGCGTGLVGVHLRAGVEILDGVDLAPRMIAAARARGVYDSLHVGEIVEFVRASPHRYDLIAAADVLIYLGDLGPLFAAARARLADGGLFAGSLERTDAVEVGLATSGRYQHHRAYVERLAATHGFTVAAFDPITARLEDGQPVPAWLFVLAA